MEVEAPGTMISMINLMINKEDLKAAVSETKGIANAKALPILENYLIVANEDSTVFLIANNLEIAVSIKLTGIVMVPGKVCVPPGILSDTLNKIPYNDMLSLVSEDDKTLQVSCGKAKMDIPLGINPNEFPIQDRIKEVNNTITVKAKEFKRLIAKTSFSASQDDSRPVLTGVNFCIDKNVMTLATVDGYRISKAWMEISEDISENITIPVKALILLIKTLSDDENLAINIGESEISFETDRMVFTGRLLIGDYHDYEQAFNQDRPNKLTVNTKLFTNAIDFAGIIGKEDKVPIVLGLNDKFVISSISNTGKINYEIEEYTYNGDDVRIGINPIYLLDVLKVIEEDEVQVMLNKELNPITIEGINYAYLILPVRLPA